MVDSLPELTSYLETLAEPHILFDRQYRILAANSAYRNQFSPNESVIGRTCFDVSHRFNVPCDQAGESCPLARSRESGQRERVLHLHHTPRGEEYVNIELVPLKNAAGEQSYFIEKMERQTHAKSVPAVQGMVGRSDAFRHMLELVARVSQSDASVLLLGESGTGKELVARAIHQASTRSSAPLVIVECSSLTESLFESELFGHERGAFTGANSAKAGLVESASGGTLFLDEVGDIPLGMQVKLLRLLESGTYRRVGSTELRQTDLRIISATHRDLRGWAGDGRFREDLYYRLSTFPIRLPALRERTSDIPILANALLSRVAPRRNLQISEGAMTLLSQAPYSGNIRELRNILERAALMCDGNTIEPSHVQIAFSTEMSPRANEVRVRPVYQPQSDVANSGRRGGSLQEITMNELREQLASHKGSRAELAKKLGISERSLYRKLRLLE
jgi:DNA-binding NtrC family response regulator